MLPWRHNLGLSLGFSPERTDRLYSAFQALDQEGHGMVPKASGSRKASRPLEIGVFHRFSMVFDGFSRFFHGFQWFSMVFWRFRRLFETVWPERSRDTPVKGLRIVYRAFESFRSHGKALGAPHAPCFRC